MLWFVFRAQQKTSQREQDRADRAQAYLQKMVDQQSTAQTQTLAQMQQLTREAVQSTLLVANTLEAVERSLNEHRLNFQANAKAAQDMGKGLAQAIEQLCARLDAQA